MKVEVALSPRTPQPRRAWDAAVALGRALGARHPDVERCEVDVHANRRELLSWRIAPVASVRVHWALVVHTEELLAVLDGDRTAWDGLAARVPAAPLPPLRPTGRVHDLTPLLERERARLVAEIEDGGGPEAAVTWGRFAGRASGLRRGLRLGSCEPSEPPLIRIHPVLDHETVPDWFVGFVIHHELLHVVFPPVRHGGRRLVHPPALQRAERAHPDYVRAVTWEKAHLPALLARASKDGP